jgi:8-oxo-dGTP pyrophosphatase MutT (NUDIX family)
MWGLYGAAGLLAHDPDRGILLQHRAAWSHHGNTWGIPGGARDRDETTVEAALRESFEEAAVPGDALRLRFSIVRSLDFWSYSTVVADVARPFEARMNDAESHQLAWVAVDEVERLDLHPGFGRAWPGLRRLLATRTELVVDVANLMGSRPDGWWRDRAGAAERLIRDLSPVRDRGCAAELFGVDAEWAWPRVTFVLEGAARAADATDAHPDVRILRAAGSGDDAIVDAVQSDTATLVVTSDRELRARVEAKGARTIGSGTFASAVGFSKSS